MNDKGFYFGLPKGVKKNIVLSLDETPQNVPNGLVLGTSGGGIGFYTKSMIAKKIAKEISNGKCK